MTFGFGRSEPLGALLNCIAIWILTLILVVESCHRLVRKPTFFDPKVMLITSLLGIIANICMATVLHGLSILWYLIKYPCMSAQEKDEITFTEGSENLNLRAVVAHIHGDLIYSVGVFIGAIIIYIKPSWQILDPCLTVLFSIVVLKITIPVFKDSILILLEANITDRKTILKVRETILEMSEVKEISSFRLWALTQNQQCAALHLTVEEGTDEQALKHRIGKYLVAFGISYWAIQVWTDNWKFKCCFKD